MYGVVSQAQLSLDNSGMHIFRASWGHHLACAITFIATIDGAILRILSSQLISFQLLAISVFSLALLCRPLERVLGPQNDPQRITKGSSGSKAHCLSVTRAAPEHISMNESSRRSLSLSALGDHHRFHKFPSSRPDIRCAQTFWALTSSSESNSELDSGLLLSTTDCGSGNLMTPLQARLSECLASPS